MTENAIAKGLRTALLTQSRQAAKPVVVNVGNIWGAALGADPRR